VWVATGLAQQLTGIERVAVECVRATFHAASGRHTVLADRGAEWLSQLPDDVDVWEVPRRTGGVARTLRTARLPDRIIGRLVVAHSFGPPLPLLQGLMSYTVHDWGPWFDKQIPLVARGAWRWAMRTGIGRADLIHFMSESTERESPKAIRPILEDKQKVYGLPYPAIRTERKHAPPRSTTPRTVLSVGTDLPRKRFRLLATACRALPSVELTLVGTGTEKYRRAPDLTGGTVVGMGRVADAVLNALYERAQLFVLVSTYEGFGLPVLEAWARGCDLLLTEAVARRLPSEIVGAAKVIPNDCTPARLGVEIMTALNGAPRRSSGPRAITGKHLVDILQDRQRLLRR
jgi:glycosyltransferase involved in cell wall biosynthesis